MSLEPLFPAEQNNEVSWYTSGLAGIVSGGIKVVEGAFSLGAELIDLGFDTQTADAVEEFFDKMNPFEEVAEKTLTGKIVEGLTQFGVPSVAVDTPMNVATPTVPATPTKLVTPTA